METPKMNVPAPKKSLDFGLAVVRYLRFDGTGDIIEIYRTPSSIVNALALQESGAVPEMALSHAVAYYTAKSTGNLPKFGIAADAPAKDGVMALMDTWAITVAPCYDDGEPVASEGEEGPTS